MLNFSKIKIILIYLILIFLSFFTLLNFYEPISKYVDKKINLGLDLQGGSYLLLEIDTEPLVNERTQGKVIPIKKFLNENNIDYQNFKLDNNSIRFQINDPNKIKKFEMLFFNKEKNLINTFISDYNTFELNLNIDKNNVKIFFSKYGLLSLNNAALNQSIEIIRRRIDDIGTKEPTILQRGDKRILVELPGLKDPDRIKRLIGKTANLNFRLVSNESTDFGVDKLLSEVGEEVLVSKRVIMSGENLIDAQPRFDNQSNSPTVYFTLDRLGAQKFGKTTTENIGKRIAIIMDEKIISSPTIKESITGGSGTISGNFSFQEATDLAMLLRSGALPTPLKIVEERTVGPDLGEDR